MTLVRATIAPGGAVPNKPSLKAAEKELARPDADVMALLARYRTAASTSLWEENPGWCMLFAVARFAR